VPPAYTNKLVLGINFGGRKLEYFAFVEYFAFAYYGARSTPTIKPFNRRGEDTKSHDLKRPLYQQVGFRHNSPHFADQGLGELVSRASGI
jgi:hypothetical protein